MFLGSYRPSFDPKTRRIALPKKIRDYVQTNDIILSLGFEKCIFGFDTKAWEDQSTKQLEVPITDRKARDLRRFMFSAAEYIRFDDQGRIVIPPSLYQYAKIRQPIIVGAGDHFEIWDEKIWASKKQEIEGEIL